MKFRKRKFLINRKIRQQYIIIKELERKTFLAFQNGFMSGREKQLKQIK